MVSPIKKELVEYQIPLIKPAFIPPDVALAAVKGKIARQKIKQDRIFFIHVYRIRKKVVFDKRGRDICVQSTEV